jgi:hypothetical protein
MFALVRPDNWEWPLLFHVLGAFVTIGAMSVVVVAALGAERAERPAASAALRRLTFRALLLAVLPAFILMRVAAEWVRSEDGFGDDTTWIGIGYVVTDAGALMLLALLLLGWRSARGASRGARDTPLSGRILAGLAPLYLLALLVATWAMTTKPD